MYNKEQKNQEKSQQNAIPLSILNDNNAVRLAILNYLLNLNRYNEEVFPCQRRLAREAGIVRESANRAIKRMEEMDWIKTKRRYNTTKIYWIHPSIFQYKDLLKYKLPALRAVLSIFMLTSALIFTNVTSKLNKNIFIKKQTTPTSLSKVITSKEVVVSLFSKKEMGMNSTVMQTIASSYGLSKQQEEQLSSFSEEALKYALNEMIRQKVNPNSPGAWLTSVAAAFEKKGQHSLKRDGMGDFQKKIIHGKTNNNHSPSSGPLLNSFMEDLDEASIFGINDPEFENHLHEISKDKSDPEGYKELVRRYNYRRTLRK